MKTGEVYGGNYLKAEDLKGGSPRVTISNVELKEFDDGKKLIISFHGKDRQLVCNRTNSSIIEEVLGSDESDDWIGKTIQLCVKKVEFSGRLVPAIRVVLKERQPAPRPAQRPAAPPPVDPEDEIPMDDPDSVPFN
jgi:hypothetical protein